MERALVQTVLLFWIWYLLDEKQIDTINELFFCSCLISIFRSTNCIVKVRDRRTTARALRPIPSQKSKPEAETASVTLVRGPWSMKLCSGEVAGKVLIVDHMR